MRKIKEYTIASALSPIDLIKIVNDKIKEDWQPIGGMTSIVFAPDGEKQQTISNQTMVKYE